MILLARQERIKTDLGRRLRTIRWEVGDPQREEFASRLGLHVNSLANYERGDRIPNLDVLLAYRENLNVDLHWLLTGKGRMFDSRTQNEVLTPISAGDKLIQLPYLDQDIASGEACASSESPQFGPLAVDRDLLKDAEAAPEGCCLLKVKGDSMVPTMPEGSLLIVDRRQTNIEQGCVYVLLVGNVLVIKRARWLADGKLQLFSENQERYPTEVFEADAVADLNVIGRAIYCFRVP